MSEEQCAAELADFLRTIGAMTFYRDAKTGIVFGYRDDQMCELRRGTRKAEDWWSGWRVVHKWYPRDGGVPQEASEV